jgi:cellulose synthase/poly-beta-1,6-N-acetylglucosamine synthase-like glycosyltransferase
LFYAVKITVLIPAHNEERDIGAAIASAQSQTYPVDRVIVIADNCTDATAEIARVQGADLVFTVGNADRKAGALNLAVNLLLPRLDDDDLILTMDADTALARDFVEQALPHLEPGVGAIGGLYYGKPGGGLLGLLQRNEFHRYNRWVARRKGRAFIVIGTGSIYRVRALRDIIAARAGGRLPGPPVVFDPTYAVEDYELTLALLQLGWRCRCPKACRVTTDVMTSWSKLFHQRVRWRRGAFECLLVYGWNPITAPYIINTAVAWIGPAFILLYAAAVLLTVAAGGHLEWEPFWLAITGLFVFDHVWTVRRGGWRGMLLAAPLIIEMLYELWQLVVLTRTARDVMLRTQQRWIET